MKMMEFLAMGNVNFVRNVKCVHIYFLKFLNMKFYFELLIKR